ncbi:MAG TPA: hypothetical protein VMB82_11900 [Acidimicrobiales bacterium]|nr:hypothetical protein [Acidimicrobiales bacterium]
MEPTAFLEDQPPEVEVHDDWFVAPGDEHDRGVETLCVGEAA